MVETQTLTCSWFSVALRLGTQASSNAAATAPSPHTPVVCIDAIAPFVDEPRAAVLLAEDEYDPKAGRDACCKLNEPPEVERDPALFCATPAAPPTFVRLIMSSQLFLRHARLSPSFPSELI